MAKMSLALSGGGFRGTLYHLGIIRFLHDAGMLRDITHITAVSGGSILAAHLVLNWEHYNGSDDDFNKVSQEILDFVRLDVPDRIVRRFPFMSLASFAPHGRPDGRMIAGFLGRGCWRVITVSISMVRLACTSCRPILSFICSRRT